jgi:hypothetical protein
LSKPAVERFGAAIFLLASGAVDLAFAGTCAAVELVCRFGRDGMNRARAAVEVFPAPAPPLGFGACGDGPTMAAAAAVGGIE